MGWVGTTIFRRRRFGQGSSSGIIAFCMSNCVYYILLGVSHPIYDKRLPLTIELPPATTLLPCIICRLLLALRTDFERCCRCPTGGGLQIPLQVHTAASEFCGVSFVRCSMTIMHNTRHTPTIFPSRCWSCWQGNAGQMNWLCRNSNIQLHGARGMTQHSGRRLGRA